MMSCSNHILFICHSRSCHGAEMVLLQAIQIAISHAHHATLLLPNIVEDEGLEAKAATIPALQVMRAPYRVAGKGWLRTTLVSLYNLYAVHKVSQIIRREGIDMIWSGTSVTLLGAAIAAKCKLRHIWHFHEPVNSLYGWRSSMRCIYRHWVDKPYTKILFISHKQQHEWEDTLGIHLPGQVIYNPIRILPVSIKSDSSCVRFGYVGNFEQRKNLPVLIRTFEQLSKRYSHVSLTLCGASDAEQIHELYAITSLKSPKLTILKKQDDVSIFYSQIDVLILPSLMETMPLVVIEAMMAHITVIQTDQSGMQELFRDQEDCLYFNPSNAHQLLSLMERCLDVNERSRLGENGYTKAMSYHFNELFTQSIVRLCAS